MHCESQVPGLFCSCNSLTPLNRLIYHLLYQSVSNCDQLLLLVLELNLPISELALASLLKMKAGTEYWASNSLLSFSYLQRLPLLLLYSRETRTE